MTEPAHDSSPQDPELERVFTELRRELRRFEPSLRAVIGLTVWANVAVRVFDDARADLRVLLDVADILPPPATTLVDSFCGPATAARLTLPARRAAIDGRAAIAAARVGIECFASLDDQDNRTRGRQILDRKSVV